MAAIAPSTRGVINPEYGDRAGRLMVLAADDGQRGDELWLLDTLCYFDGQPLWLMKEYVNTRGEYQSILDTSAFAD